MLVVPVAMETAVAVTVAALRLLKMAVRISK
jgi:hypothetical protein